MITAQRKMPLPIQPCRLRHRMVDGALQPRATSLRQLQSTIHGFPRLQAAQPKPRLLRKVGEILTTGEVAGVEIMPIPELEGSEEEAVGVEEAGAEMAPETVHAHRLSMGDSDLLPTEIGDPATDDF